MHYSLILFISLWFSTLCFGQTPSIEDFNSDQIQIQPNISTESTEASNLSTKLLSQRPKGITTRVSPKECSPEVFAATPADKLQQLFDSCEKSLYRFHMPSLLAMGKIAGIKYNLQDHSRIREVRVHLQNGIVRRGFLGVKPTSDPRPLVIIQCAILCDTVDSSMRLFIMHLFDESPFHILALSSMSGEEYMKDNHQYGLAGFEEGAQLIQIAQILKNPEQRISKYISQVHVAGFSLGGHSALYAALYNSFIPNEAKPISSVFALCPVVDLQASINDLSHKSKVSKILGNHTYSLLMKGLGLKFIDIDAVEIPRLTSYKKDQLKEFLEALVDYKIKQRREKVKFMSGPFKGLHLENGKDFWQISDLAKYANAINTQTLVWASDDDPIVESTTNARRLQNVNTENIHTLYTKHGAHCSGSSYYGWQTTSAIMRSFFLSQSHELIQKATNQTIALDPEFIKERLKLYSGEKYFSQEWHAEDNNPKITLTFKIWAPYRNMGNTKCGTWNPYYAYEGCFRYVDMDINLSDLNFSAENMPRTNAEAQGLTRWANTNLRVTDSRGSTIIDTLNVPSHINWVSY